MFVFFYDSGIALTSKTDWRKRFMDAFRPLTYRHQSWRVWSDFVEISACAIANRVDEGNYEARERRYLEIMKTYERKELDQFPKLLAILVQALDEDQEQDFLGQLFMSLELGNHWRGQFFTPYNVCKAMAEMQVGDLTEQVERKGFISVNDPACGAGATLIAFANAAKARGINYQNHVLFVAQDVDQTAALMCYLQLSLLGCSGYVIVGNTLTMETREVWYTPMWFSGVWQWRRMFHNLKG